MIFPFQTFGREVIQGILSFTLRTTAAQVKRAKEAAGICPPANSGSHTEERNICWRLT